MLDLWINLLIFQLDKWDNHGSGNTKAKLSWILRAPCAKLTTGSVHSEVNTNLNQLHLLYSPLAHYFFFSWNAYLWGRRVPFYAATSMTHKLHIFCRFVHYITRHKRLSPQCQWCTDLLCSLSLSYQPLERVWAEWINAGVSEWLEYLYMK